MLKNFFRTLLITLLAFTQNVFATEPPYSSPTKSTEQQESKTIRLSNGEWAPFLSKKLPHFGFASHIVSEAFSLVGITVEYDFLPWKRAEELAKSGRRDGSVVWSFRESRNKWGYFSDPVIIERVVLFHSNRIPVIEWSEIEDLQGMKVSMALGSSAPTFEAASDKHILHLLKSGDIESNFKMLLRGRSDIFPLIKKVGDHYLRTRFSKEMSNQITFSPTIFEPQKYHLILSRSVAGNQKVLEQFNIGLKKLRESGRYQELVELFNQGYYDG